MAIKAIINNTEKEIEQIKNSDEQDIDYVYSRIGDTEVEGEPPISIKSIGGNLADYRIYGNTVGGESVGDLVESGQHAGEYEVPMITSRKAKHTATLQLHDCLPSTMQFDAAEALYYAENGLTAGTYNFTIQDYDTAYGGGKTYQFTLANDVPAKGQLVFGWSYNTQASAAKITSYASSTSTTAIEQVGVTEGSGGTSLGTTDGNSTNVNHIHRARYGSNNYKESAIRQFLNCNAVAGSVWTPQTKYDRPPSWNSNTAGFMKDIDSDFLAALGTSPKVVALNTVIDGGGSVTINNDKFFLLSRSEVYGGKENNIDEGEPYTYYSNYSDLSAEGTGDDSNRTKYRSGTAQVWWLRSPNSAYGGSVHCVSASGYVGYNYAYVSFGVAPACNIELDDNYAYKGQVLHVRDQISVQKGNDTLIFDVIGIDHDDVDFDVTTTNLYLPEQIRKVGDEAEYIDYSEQKLHRVRKNLLQNQAVDREIEGVTFTVNSDGSITCNGTASDNTNSGSISSSSLPAGSYYLNGTPSGGSLSTYYMYVACYTESEIILYNDVGDGVSFTIDNSCNINVRIAIKSGCTCNNLTFYPMIRKADITDDTYEPYIVNTEVNTNLPALPTIKGTNTFSVNTSIQPSNIYIKDSFDYKKVFTATRTIEDELPLNYRNIEDNDSTLDNYRIYGNTVGGESVGDRTGNLFDENGVVTKIFIEGDGTMDIGANGDEFIYNRINVLPNITYTFSWQQMILGTGNNTPYIRVSSYDANNNFLARDLIQVDVYPNKTCSITTRNNAAFWDIRIDDASSKRGQHLEEVMLNAGSTALPYEPYGYKVLVTISNGTDTLTTPIYLPEQIRKVGDEAEYIDCGEQKQHVDADEEIEKQATTYMVSITPKTDVSKIVCVTMSSVPDDCTILTSGLIFTPDEADANTLNSTNYADGVRGKATTFHNHKFTWTKTYIEGETYYIRSYVKYQTADNEIKEDYGDVYKADINGFERVRKNLLPNTATSQTINTGLDGTLPALPTLPGTNVLSVGTAVQPSEVYIKGKIKEAN